MDEQQGSAPEPAEGGLILPEFVSLDELAERFNVSAATVHRWRARGLPAAKLGKRGLWTTESMARAFVLGLIQSSQRGREPE